MSSKALWEPKHQNSFPSHLPSEGLPRFSTQNGAEKNAAGTCSCSLTGKVTHHPLAPQSEQTYQRRLILRNRLAAGGAHPGAGGPHPWFGGAGSPARGALWRRCGDPQTLVAAGKFLTCGRGCGWVVVPCAPWMLSSARGAIFRIF